MNKTARPGERCFSIPGCLLCPSHVSRNFLACDQIGDGQVRRNLGDSMPKQFTKSCTP